VKLKVILQDIDLAKS